MSSIWVKETIEKPSFDRLEGDIKTDVLIIGGGIAGILCAYELKEAGVDFVLVEKSEICSGVTQNTTAKITLQHGLIYDKMIRRFGKEKAELYVSAQKLALEKYKTLCQKIDCDYENKDAFLYSLNDEKSLEKETIACQSLGIKADITKKTELPFKVACAVRVGNQAQFNPLKFLYEISKELPIYENTKVLELKGTEATTQYGKIKAEKIVVATHFPFLNKHGSYYLKMFQHRSYVLSLEGAENINGMYVDMEDKGLSFRTYKKSLLLGGGGHRTGKTGGGYKELESFVGKYYSDAIITGRWATQDCMTLDDVPYIGIYSQNTPNLFVVTGFNKWGMSSSMVGARVIRDIIKNGKSEYAPIFLPSRTILRPQLFINTFETAKNFVTPTSPRCPHLGCALKYNKEEHSWDCPCHGSRFNENGEVLNNPATDDLKRK